MLIANLFTRQHLRGLPDRSSACEAVGLDLILGCVIRLALLCSYIFFSVTRDEASAYTIDRLNSFSDYIRQNEIREY